MKPSVSVMFEGTLTQDHDIPVGNVGEFKPDVLAKMQVLSQQFYIYIVSGATRFPWGVPLLIDRLSSEGIPFDEIWAGDRLPDVTFRFDDEAQKL